MLNENPTAWLDWLAIAGYLGIATFVAWQVVSRR